MEANVVLDIIPEDQEVLRCLDAEAQRTYQSLFNVFTQNEEASSAGVESCHAAGNELQAIGEPEMAGETQSIGNDEADTKSSETKTTISKNTESAA